MPREEKRALSVTTGIANMASIDTAERPVSATLKAMIASEPTHAANIQYSGRAVPSIRVSASQKSPAATSSGAIVHQPTQGPEASSASASTPRPDRT
ncbi:MAG TPA: hypothetical protein VNP96_05475 [Solirubrobacterales bacterium]|nr:hypothetical protein [Solirubrobacterales bacterium]